VITGNQGREGEERKQKLEAKGEKGYLDERGRINSPGHKEGIS